MSKKILIAGGAGFIGSHLVKKLLNEGHQISVWDNLITGRLSNLEDVKNDIQFFNQDISNSSIEYSGSLDEIYNLASPASPIDFPKFPIEILRTGAIGQENLLQLALKKSARILMASTSEVYGDPQEHPQKETYFGNVNTIGARSCYDEAKRYSEAISMAYHKTHHVDIRIARIFNTYGPQMRPNDGRVMPNFFSQILKNEDITVYGEGKQTRSFCYVDDMVQGLIALMGSSDVITPVNLGNPDERTILSLAEDVLKLSSGQSKIIYKPLPENDPLLRRPDISKATELLNWKPHVEFSIGLEKTYQYFLENI